MRPIALFKAFSQANANYKKSTTNIHYLIWIRFCGGTTGNIVVGFLAETVEIDISTMTKELLPIGKLSEIDLVTEGILTISKALEILKKCNCDISRLPSGKTGAVLLANEILSADSILFLVGQQINEFYLRGWRN